VLGIATWLLWSVAVVFFLVIAFAGFVFLRAIAGIQPRERIEPEDVQDLDVFLVCGECGTEFHVTRVGEIQVPRHCGEPMQVTRRPRQQPQLN
jgi:glyoxylate carboligase